MPPPAPGGSVDSPSAQPRRRLLCHQGDHLGPVGTSPFTLLGGTRVRALTPSAPWSLPQIQPCRAGPRHSTPKGDISPPTWSPDPMPLGSAWATQRGHEKEAPPRDRGQGRWMHRGPSGSAAEDTYRGAGLSGGSGVSGEADGALKREEAGPGVSTPPGRRGDKPVPACHPENGLSAWTPQCPSQPGTFCKHHRVWVMEQARGQAGGTQAGRTHPPAFWRPRPPVPTLPLPSSGPRREPEPCRRAVPSGDSPRVGRRTGTCRAFHTRDGAARRPTPPRLPCLRPVAGAKPLH